MSRVAEMQAGVDGFFDFLYEESTEQIYDLVLMIYNKDLQPWLDKLSFMHLRYKIISDKQKYNKDLNSDSVVYTNGKFIKNLWTYIFNNYKSFNYAIIGENDTPDNFDIMYLDYIDRQVHIEINDNPNIYQNFNVSFNMINEYIDVPGSNYMIFKSNYLKFCLANDNGMNLRHRLIYYRNIYKQHIKSCVVEYLGCNTPINAAGQKKLLSLRLTKSRLWLPTAFVSFFELILVMMDSYQFFIKCNVVMLVFMFLFCLQNSLIDEVY